MQGVGLVSPFRYPNQYYQKVIRIAGSNLLAYWPQWEISGGVSHDISGNSLGGERDGAYTGVTLGQPGVGDGTLAPLYDGANDFNNISGAPLAAAFNGDAGTAFIWGRASGAGVWTDGVERRLLTIIVNGSNFVILQKQASNILRILYNAGGILEAVANAAFSGLDFFSFGTTWDKSAEEMKVFFNGPQIGVTQVALGVWVGIPGAIFIGSASAIPTLLWDGFLAHCFLMDRAATVGEMVSFASLNDD